MSKEEDNVLCKYYKMPCSQVFAFNFAFVWQCINLGTNICVCSSSLLPISFMVESLFLFGKLCGSGDSVVGVEFDRLKWVRQNACESRVYQRQGSEACAWKFILCPTKRTIQNVNTGNTLHSLFHPFSINLHFQLHSHLFDVWNSSLEAFVDFWILCSNLATSRLRIPVCIYGMIMEVRQNTQSWAGQLPMSKFGHLKAAFSEAKCVWNICLLQTLWESREIYISWIHILSKKEENVLCKLQILAWLNGLPCRLYNSPVIRIIPPLKCSLQQCPVTPSNATLNLFDSTRQ